MWDDRRAGPGSGSRAEGQRRALRHPARRRLVALVTEEPGILLGALPGRVGVSWATLWFHLRILALVGLVRFRTEDRHRRVYPGALPRPVVSVGRVRLQDPAARRLAEALVRRPGCGLGEAAATVASGSVCLAHHHASRLERAGLVRPGSRGGRRVLEPTEELARLLSERTPPQAKP